MKFDEKEIFTKEEIKEIKDAEELRNYSFTEIGISVFRKVISALNV